ncbi:hypothetical protein F5Y04DRAFT_281646 [Hypomontagnella monticulosa]|nr:hypothetical protein F5Y04DRAFT_281646 [Hypomontagnella monticulosa]
MAVTQLTETSKREHRSATPACDNTPGNAQRKTRGRTVPGEAGQCYFWAGRPTNLILRFSHDHKGIPVPKSLTHYPVVLILYMIWSWIRKPQRQWVGLLQVKCDDISQLMREGFFWSADDILQEQGFLGPPRYTSSSDVFNDSEERNLRETGLSRMRSYFLSDSRHEPERWVAHFQIFARSDEVLGGIRLENLRIEDVFSAEAKGNAGQLIYRYSRSKPKASMNALYDGMVMEGWWPWPKKAKKVKKARKGSF